jgi:hypothetical protein
MPAALQRISGHFCHAHFLLIEAGKEFEILAAGQYPA